MLTPIVFGSLRNYPIIGDLPSANLAVEQAIIDVVNSNRYGQFSTIASYGDAFVDRGQPKSSINISTVSSNLTGPEKHSAEADLQQAIVKQARRYLTGTHTRIDSSVQF